MNSLCRDYGPEKDQWITFETPNSIPPRTQMNTVINDELLMVKLNKLKPAESKIELDTLYLSAAVSNKGFEKPFLPNLPAIADNKSGMIIDQHMLTPRDNTVYNILSIFINYMMQMGKPKTVYVRDEYIQDYLRNLCERIGVELKVKWKLKVIDRYEKEYMKRGFWDGWSSRFIRLVWNWCSKHYLSTG